MSSQGQAQVGTVGNFLLGAGAVYLNYTTTPVLIGATKGGSTFNSGKEIREVEQDGAYGPIKGHITKTRIAPTLTVANLELTSANLNIFMGGATTTDQTTYDEIKENLAIVAGDYIDDIAWVGEAYDGEDVIIILENVLVTEALELAATSDKEEVVPEIVFSATYDPAAATTVPYEIRRTKS